MTLREASGAESRSGTIRGLAGRLFRVRHPYASNLDVDRAHTVMVTSVVLAALGIIGGGILTSLSPADYPPSDIIPPLILAAQASAVIYALAQFGQLRLASLLLVVVTSILPIGLNWTSGITGLGPMAFALPVVTAALLIGPRAGYLAMLPALFGIALIEYRFDVMAVPEGLTAAQGVTRLLLRVFEAGIYLTLIALLSSQLSNSLRRLADAARQRALQLEAAALVSEAAASAPTVGALLNLAVERIREAFGFYHAQVFLVDQEGRNARLEASTGRAGVALLARGHSLPVGSRSVIGQSTYTGKPVVINDVRTDPTHRPNDLLPDTRAELSLPLTVGGSVIGALDVQSTQVNVFGDDEVTSLQVMANQLAGYIEKARLLAELTARTSEQQNLIEDAQNNLRQIEELNRRLTREGWSEYLQLQRARGTLGYTLQAGTVRDDSDWTAPMRQAFTGEQSVVIRHDQQAHIAALPLKVRGEVIGVLEIERDGTKPWTDNELEMAETLIDRLSVAVENARLYEQATLSAQREHVVNRIAQDVQAAESVDQILQAALTELSSMLGASRGVVQLQAKAERGSSTSGG